MNKSMFQNMRRIIAAIAALLMIAGCTGIVAFADEEPHTHTPGETVMENITDPDCTTDGSYDVVVYCIECGEEISRETVITPASGHVAGDSVHENEIVVTCTTDGSYDAVVYCSECGEEISRETVITPAAGHVWDQGMVTVEATEEAGGELAYTCTVCGETMTEPIPRLPVEESELYSEPELVLPAEPTSSQSPVPASGNCGLEGENLTWEIDDSGKLTIKGTGNMENYEEGKTAPWYENRDGITSVEVADGVSGVGNYAFAGCTKLAKIRIPESVTSIGNSALKDCAELKLINYGGTEQSWDAIVKGEDNLALVAAEKQYEKTSDITEEQPDTEDEHSIYTVSFDGNGHALMIEDQLVPEGGMVMLPSAPVEESAVFVGWFTDAEGVNAWNFDSDIVTSDMTLYAGWITKPVLAGKLVFNDENQRLLVSAGKGAWIRIESEDEEPTGWIRIEDESSIDQEALKRMDAGSYDVFWYYGSEEPATGNAGTLVGQVVIDKADAIVIDEPEVNVEEIDTDE